MNYDYDWWIENYDEVGCCCATITIGGFPYESEVESMLNDWGGSIKDFKCYLKNKIERELKSASLSNKSLVVCTTNSNQTTAASVLKSLGFRSSRAAQRPRKSPSTTVKLWYYHTVR